jgi:hypothetical protein
LMGVTLSGSRGTTVGGGGLQSGGPLSGRGWGPLSGGPMSHSPFLGDVNLLKKNNISNLHSYNSFHEQNTFWRPGNLNFARRRYSMTAALYLSEERMLMMGCPIFTRATVPIGAFQRHLSFLFGAYI